MKEVRVHIEQRDRETRKIQGNLMTVLLYSVATVSSLAWLLIASIFLSCSLSLSIRRSNCSCRSEMHSHCLRCSRSRSIVYLSRLFRVSGWFSLAATVVLLRVWRDSVGQWRDLSRSALWPFRLSPEERVRDSPWPIPVCVEVSLPFACGILFEATTRACPAIHHPTFSLLIFDFTNFDRSAVLSGQ